MHVLRKVSIITSIVILLKSFLLLLVTFLIVDIKIITLKKLISVGVYLIILVSIGGFLWDLYTKSLLYFWFDLFGLKKEVERIEEGYGCIWFKSLTFWQWWMEIILFWKIRIYHINSLHKHIVNIILASKIISDIILVLHIVMI